jgi:hypothetical protein
MNSNCGRRRTYVLQGGCRREDAGLLLYLEMNRRDGPPGAYNAETSVQRKQVLLFVAAEREREG